MRGFSQAGVLDVLMELDAFDAAGMLISPYAPLDISRVCHDPDVMQRVYDIGRKAGEAVDIACPSENY